MFLQGKKRRIDLNNNLLEENNLSKTLMKYAAYWRLFAICVLIALVSMFLYIRYVANTQYNVTSTILIKDKDPGEGSFQAEGVKNLGLLKTNHNVEDEIGIIKSKGIMEKVVSKLSLTINFYDQGTIRDVEIYGEQSPFNVLVDETASRIMYGVPIYIKSLDANRYELKTTVDGKKYKAEHQFGDVVTENFATFTITRKPETTFEEENKIIYFVIRDKERVIDQTLSQLSVGLVDLEGDLVDINYLAENKDKGEDIVSGLIETYVEEMIKYENELAETTIKMIDERVKLLSGELSGVEKSVEELQTKNELTSGSGRTTDVYIEQTNDYKKLIADYQSQIDILRSLESFVSSGEGNAQIPNALSATDAALRDNIERYNETLSQKKRLLQSASGSNPVVVSLDEELSDIKTAILQSARSARNGLLIAQRNLQSNADKYDAQIAKVPMMERQLLDISRQQSTKEGLYQFLLQKREEEVLSLAAPVSSTRIVSLPKAGLYPVSPNKKLFYFAGLLLGLFSAFGIIYVKDSLNNTITTVDDLTEKTTAPFLGEISKSEQAGIIMNDNEAWSHTAELFRLLCFNLDYLKKTPKNQSLLVTSTVKGEGKTFIASNLAVILANNGEKVVALSFDLRQPRLMQNFDMNNAPGITDYILQPDMNVSQIIQKHASIPNLYLIGAGSATAQIGRLMLSERIEVLMKNLKENFGRIIIDSAPIGSVSDAFALNLFIDGTIYVTRQDVTLKEHVKTINNIHQNDKLKNTMVLFNDTEAGNSYGYGQRAEQEAGLGIQNLSVAKILRALKK